MQASKLKTSPESNVLQPVMKFRQFFLVPLLASLKVAAIEKTAGPQKQIRNWKFEHTHLSESFPAVGINVDAFMQAKDIC